mgnify:CR=1 FL=1
MSKEGELSGKVVNAGTEKDDGWAHEDEIDLGDVLDVDTVKQQDQEENIPATE